MNQLPDNLASEDNVSLLELLDRVLNTGVVLVGDVTVRVAGVDLVYLSLRALLTSVESAHALEARRFAAPARMVAALDAMQRPLPDSTEPGPTEPGTREDA